MLATRGTIQVSWSWFKGQFIDDVLTFWSFVNFRYKIFFISKDEYSFLFIFYPPPLIMLFSRDIGYLLGDPPLPHVILNYLLADPPLPLSG